MSTAKNRHLETYEWSTRLARQHRVCVRSALRGLGPGRQCEELPLTEFITGAAAIAGQPGVPVGLENTCVILYFFVLREIELGTMLVKSVEVDYVKAVVCIRLPATKTDPMALSCSRSWGCVCLPEATDRTQCPFHAAAAQLALLRRTFGDKTKEEDFPFSPMPTGKPVEKEQMVKATRRAAEAAGFDLLTEDGLQRITGHVGRIGGCRMLLRRGVSIPSTMSLARWDSMAILRYAKYAHLMTTTGEFRRGLVRKKIDTEVEEKLLSNRFSDATLDRPKELELEATKNHNMLLDLNRKVQELEDVSVPRYIVSDKYQKWHTVAPWKDVERCDWLAKCGWKYGARASTKFVRKSKLPDDLDVGFICKDCFPERHRLAALKGP